MEDLLWLLTQESRTLQELRKDIRGFGMSDTDIYARVLAEKLDYTNTYYDRDPNLDICNPDPAIFGTYDFIHCRPVKLKE